MECAPNVLRTSLILPLYIEFSLRLFVSLAPLLLLTVFNFLSLAALLLPFISFIFYLPPLLSTHTYPYSIQAPDARANQYPSFIPVTTQFRNRLPLPAFPPSFGLQLLERGVSRHVSL